MENISAFRSTKYSVLDARNIDFFRIAPLFDVDDP